ncbi:MAG: hypothetical protein HZC10_05255 [Nitrospirae bacterium]|nr:hypothetical protein [Nitrospirota bacterium]
MKKISIVFLLLFVLVSCAPAGYRFSMLKPESTPNIKYSDENIEIFFSFPTHAMMGVEGTLQYRQYTGIGFVLKNKTNETITINWDRVAIKDAHGRSGNQVMHTGMKYNECSSLKAVTVIPAKSQTSDTVIPCYALQFRTGGGWVNPYWNISMLPSPRQLSKADIGLFMPLQIGNKNVDYNFEFQAVAQ